MSQEGFALFGSIAGGVHKFLQAVLFLIMWDVFFRPQREKKTLLFAGGFAAVNVLLHLCPPVPGWVRYVVCAALVLGYCRFKYRGCMEKAVFTLLLFYHFHGMSYLIASSIYQVLNEEMLGGLDVMDAGYLEQMYRMLVIGQSGILLLYTLAFSVMIWVLKKVVKRPPAMNLQEVVFLSALNVVGSMLTWIVIDISAVPVEQEVFSSLPREGKWCGRSRCLQSCSLPERSRRSSFFNDTRNCR